MGEIVERITRKNENLESTLPLTISAQYGLIDQNEFFDKRIASKDVSGYFLVKNGEFAYNKSTSSDAPWGAIKRLDRYESGVLSTLYIVFKILNERKTSSDYIVTYYNTDLWHKGIPVISIHGLRHTHASLLLFTGVSIASVARRLGHSSMTTTQKTYLHIIQELENKDIDLVMRSLSGLN